MGSSPTRRPLRGDRVPPPGPTTPLPLEYGSRDILSIPILHPDPTDFHSFDHFLSSSFHASPPMILARARAPVLRVCGSLWIARIVLAFSFFFFLSRDYFSFSFSLSFSTILLSHAIRVVDVTSLLADDQRPACLSRLSFSEARVILLLDPSRFFFYATTVSVQSSVDPPIFDATWSRRGTIPLLLYAETLVDEWRALTTTPNASIDQGSGDRSISSVLRRDPP